MLVMFGVACFLGGWQANEWKRQRELDRAKAVPANSSKTHPATLRAAPQTSETDFLFGDAPAGPTPANMGDLFDDDTD